MSAKDPDTDQNPMLIMGEVDDENFKSVETPQLNLNNDQGLTPKVNDVKMNFS
jgi:hypothetical protein